MLRHLRITDGRLVESDQQNGQILFYVAPDESERRYLVDVLKLDEHTLNSALDPDEVARVEFEPEHAAIILKRPRNYSSADTFVFKATSAGLFLFPDKLVVVIAEDAPLFEGRPVMRVATLRDVVLRLIYRSIFHFNEHLKVINAISSELEHQINTAMENRQLLNMFTLEKSLVYYLSAINANGWLIEKLRANGARMGLQQENIEFLDDLIIENNQCARQAEIYSNVLAGMMDARASVVANNLNLLIKKLTLITIAIMVPTLVVSIFSMNVRLPLEQQHGILSFWLITVLAFMSAGAVFWIWWYKKL